MEKQKIMHLGTINEYGNVWSSVYCKITLKTENEKPVLSIIGVIRPNQYGNASSCGQIDSILREKDSCDWHIAKGWTYGKIAKFLIFWDKYHLNNAHSNCIHQEEAGITYATDSNNICDVCGYKIGSAWTYSDIPEEVINWLFNLPDADKTPAWI